MNTELILSAALLSIVCGCNAQATSSLAINEVETSGWECPDSSQAFHKLWTTMDSIQFHGTGNLTILYIGGSHVQGGWIGHELRRFLSNWAPQAVLSRGMQLPYRIAQTNTPTHFRTQFGGNWTAAQCTRGNGQTPCESAPIATGLLAYPADSTFIQHVSYLPDSSRTACTSLEIWTNAERRQWRWMGNAPLKSCSPLPRDLGWRLEFEFPADTLAISFSAPHESELWYAGMNGRNSSSLAHITLHEWGHNGLRIRHTASHSGWLNLFQRIEPDLIFVGVGLNDAVDGELLNMKAFAHHYEKLTEVLSSSGAAVLLLGNTPAVHRERSLEAPSAAIGRWLRQHSQAREMAYLDLTTALGGPNLTSEWVEDGLMQADGMHFTAEGYGAIASVLFETWMDSYSQTLKTSHSNKVGTVQ